MSDSVRYFKNPSNNGPIEADGGYTMSNGYDQNKLVLSFYSTIIGLLRENRVNYFYWYFLKHYFILYSLGWIRAECWDEDFSREKSQTHFYLGGGLFFRFQVVSSAFVRGKKQVINFWGADSLF